VQNFLTRYDGRPINQLEYRMEALEFSIKARDYDRVFVDAHDKGVWLSVSVQGGSVYTVLTKEQAKELIAALQQVIA
jgi:hypothetical protein